MSRQEIVLMFVVGAFVLGSLLGITSIGMSRAEYAECVRWEKQQNEIVKWYSTDWQKAQCEQFDIFLVK